ncbi:MAG: ATP-binding protein [Armatimonadota bacterium]|nr:ATP-binding protein [Armatimonadota bacterium]MDR7485109.1 ATP-binding protein [Armatimonadota bacterium]MDR7533497.1 ATP-binding protein [Armatimonadota bacterium]MDR7537002.1 ATP-binding protein [Armatimonadota bacterium]
MPRRVLLSWSSGKDSAWTLHMLRQDPDVEVVSLLTTVNTTHGRVAMHSTRLEILQAQAHAVELPLHIVPLPWPCSNEVYERTMRKALADGLERGATHVAFGDLFLEDIRAYRIRQLKSTGLEPLFPIWHEPTGVLARRMIDAGVEAILTCVDPNKLSPSFAGRTFDHAFLAELPAGVDPCGENGEFHTCVLAGPMFRGRLHVAVGEVLERDGFYFADLMLRPPPLPGGCTLDIGAIAPRTEDHGGFPDGGPAPPDVIG